jgi:tRNA1(Val) A37 N6-methylase TrmN6
MRSTGADAAGIADQPDPAAFTIDAFHRGRFHLMQPARGAHRAGTDAMLLAGAVPGGFAGRLADLGAGAGAAGLAVAARCPDARIVLVENAPDMLDCARKSLQLPENQWLSSRATVLGADVTLTGRLRQEAGLEDGSFDFAIFNPPFNAIADRASPHEARERAHVMPAGLFEQWLRTAAAIVRPGGGMALIARPASLPEILAALKGRFGGATIKPVHPQADKAAIRIVVRAVRGSRAAMTIAPALVLHEKGSNRLAAGADAVNNGLASLFGD